MTIEVVAFGCGGSETNGSGHPSGSGGQLAEGGSAGSTGGSGGTTAAGGAGTTGSGGRQSPGGGAGEQSSGGKGGGVTVANGGASAGGNGGASSHGSGGYFVCPPCAAPPHPGCVGEGPCGCGPYVCPDAGNGEFCSGQYRRQEISARCVGAQPVLWEVSSGNLGQFAPPACKDLGTNIPRFCCTPEFTPACPG